MGVFDILFILNLVVMVALAVYHCRRKERKTMIRNLVVIALFVLIKVIEVCYSSIKTQLYDMLGEEMFNSLRDLLSALLFFGSSVTVGVQLISDLLSVVLLLLFAARVASILLTKSKRLFDRCECPKDERHAGKCDRKDNKYLFLELGRLLN